jgi:hypothetical protein
MVGLLVFCTSLCAAAGPVSPKPAVELSRSPAASLPEAALARFGGDRLTTLQPLEAIELVADGKELHGWDGRALHRWELPSGRPLGRSSLPSSVNPPGRPFGQIALSPRGAQLAWLRLQGERERLQVWDFQRKKLVLDRDVTPEGKERDYARLAWSEDGKELVAILDNKQAHVYDLGGKLVEKTRVVDGKAGPELASGRRLRESGRVMDGLTARRGKALVRIKLEPDRREFPKGDPRGRQRLGHVLTFTDLASGKSAPAGAPLDLAKPGMVVGATDGRHFALVDESRVRIWDVATRRELEFAHALPRISQMVVSPGGAYVQFQRDPIWHPGTPWSSLQLANGLLRRLEAPATGDRLTLGLGPMGFAAGKDQFVGITGRSLDRWDLKTGRRLGGAPLPDTPSEKGHAPGYDECLLLGDGLSLVQFACIYKHSLEPKRVFDSTWRFWSPERKDEPLRRIPDCTWQRGAAGLPQKRFLYFVTLPEKPAGKDTKVQPGVTFRERGVMQLYFGRLDRPGSHHPGAFSGQWCELRGASRGGHLLLMSEESSAWVQTSRNSQSSWFDPAVQRHCLLEFHSGGQVVDARALGKVIGDGASHLSADGRFLLVGSDNKLLLYEPYVLGKVVKELPLPATPARFAVSPDGKRVACQLDDATLMILDGERLARFVDVALAKERPKGLEALVGELASGPPSAYRAARLLAAAGDPGVAALRKGMDGRAPAAGQIAGWVRDLGSADFATRERAESALAGWGAPVEKALRDALSSGPSAEKRLRLRRLLTRLARCPYGDRELAQARAVLALDWNGSPTAMRLLGEWADRFPDSVLGAESKFALANRAGR